MQKSKDRPKRPKKSLKHKSSPELPAPELPAPELPAPRIAPLFVRPSQLKSIINISNTTAWRLEKKGKFPKRRQIAPGCSGWLYSELIQYVESC